jgi:hypothetical protein
LITTLPNTNGSEATTPVDSISKTGSHVSTTSRLMRERRPISPLPVLHLNVAHHLPIIFVLAGDQVRSEKKGGTFEKADPNFHFLGLE